MKKHHSIIKELAIAVIFLLIAVAVAPSITIQIVKASTEGKLEKVTTETSSISTLQIKTKLLTTYNDFVEKLKTENVTIKHKLLLAYVVLISNIQMKHFLLTGAMVVALLYQAPSNNSIVHFLQIIRVFYLIFKTMRIVDTLLFRIVVWEEISQILGWNWDKSPNFPLF